MAAVHRRSRVLEGECLECLVEGVEEAYASEPQRYKNTASTTCFGPLLAPVAVVERATWEARFQLAAWNELGRDWRLSNAAKSFQLCGFPSALLASWVNDIVKKCREPSLEAWDREYPSVKYCERGDSEKHRVGRLVRGYVFLTMRSMELLFEHAKVTRRYQHPALTKAVAGFVTYEDHAAWLEKQAKARAKREAQQERRALEEDYLAKRNERLRMLVVPGWRERLAANGNYPPSRDPMFNGQGKAASVKYAMDLSEVPPTARGVYDNDACWVTDFLGQFRKPGKRRRR
eukprot:jgi/Tetstr1/432141/TSEL_021598.t1